VKHIVSIAFTTSSKNLETTFTFQGEEVRLSQFSTNCDTKLLNELISKYDGHCDVLSVSEIPAKVKSFYHRTTKETLSTQTEVPLVDGTLLKKIYIPWVLRRATLEYPELLTNKRIGFYSGVLSSEFIECFSSDNELVFFDLFFLLNRSKTIKGAKSLYKFIKYAAPILNNFPIKTQHASDFSAKKAIMRKMKDIDVIVSSAAMINFTGDFSYLKDKVLVIDTISQDMQKRLLAAGVKSIIICLPQLIDSTWTNFSIIEATFQAFHHSTNKLDSNDILAWIDKLGIKPEVVHSKNKLNTINEIQKFAFIIHPLSSEYFYHHKALHWMKKIPIPTQRLLEVSASCLPGIFYGKMKGIKSISTGKEVECLLYSVLETPKEMMKKDPDVMYKKILALIAKAKEDGAVIAGLGAYTKIVGDAGVTINQLSPMPITTGNSLSAASTLWAASYAIQKMNLVEKKDGIYQGTVMVIGATGSIGAVAAKILSKGWRKIIIVAPRAYKLLELKESILATNSNAHIVSATNPADYLPMADLIITSTSAKGEKILDIAKVKSGAVICDVSRPFDISPKDAQTRPDVMVIASGEVTLPGNMQSSAYLGLEGDAVYACLAETAILAMEGLLESFTLSREINYEKVVEIDRLAKKHGVALAEIMGHTGIITNREFELCRQHVKG
jgi:predicted amino acid dehydrogenase